MNQSPLGVLGEKNLAEDAKGKRGLMGNRYWLILSSCQKSEVRSRRSGVRGQSSHLGVLAPGSAEKRSSRQDRKGRKGG